MITRCTNNYGPRQFYEKLIPKTIFLANQNKKIPIYGKGENIRDWIYVNDHCEAVLRVLLDGKKGESYNVSSDNEIDNLSIVKKILELLGKSSDLIEFVTDRPGHDLRYSLNSSKIKNSLKWNPKISFDDGIQNTIDWLNNNSRGKDISENILGSTPWKKS